MLGGLPVLAIEILPSVLYFKIDEKPYLVFHNVAEIFSVIVSMSIFGLGWTSYTRTHDRHSLYLSSAFLAIGLIDFMHTLGHVGMPDFITENTANKSSQFWIAVRLYAAVIFLTSAFFRHNNRQLWISRPVMLAFSLTFTVATYVLVIVFPGVLPDTFIPGIGLTVFKKNAEYLIILLLAVPAIIYARDALQRKDRYNAYYSAALILCVFSELAFALYSNFFDSFNMLGHVYKILAFALIYKGLFIASIVRPYETLATVNNELNQKIIEHAAAQKQIESLSQDLMRITETERSQIAGELHDSLGQSLVLASLNLKQLLTKIPEMTQSEKDLFLSPIKKALETSRAISHRLSPVHLESLGIRLAIEDLIDDVARSGKLKITHNIRALQNVFPSGWNIEFYRIVQEALTNILKHANTCTVSLVAEKTPSGHAMIISDNGVCEDNSGNNPPGLGLLLMQQRAKTFGGKVETRRLNPGFQVRIEIPVQEIEIPASA